MKMSKAEESNEKENCYHADALQYTKMKYTKSDVSVSEPSNSRKEEQQTVIQAQSTQYSVHLSIPFKELCIGTLLLPLCSMFICFTTAYIFQPDDIHETHCRVYNIIPSISAITGISPQRYLWRISIAIHVGPRFLIAFAYRNFYKQVLAANTTNIPPAHVTKAKRLISILFWLSIIEIVALTGVTYISNRENYRKYYTFNNYKQTFSHLKCYSIVAMHEKIFISFMTASLLYMLLTINLWHTLYPNGPPTPEEVFSLKMKKIFFALSILSAISLVIFFAKHRFLCHDMGKLNKQY